MHFMEIGLLSKLWTTLQYLEAYYSRFMVRIVQRHIVPKNETFINSWQNCSLKKEKKKLRYGLYRGSFISSQKSKLINKIQI